MALEELSSDLIQQVKISTRIESGLPDYNPNDPSLPSLPSLSASVASFDPSPPYLRCNHCKGKLLRGVNSLICIYCGHKLNNSPDVGPDPISFKSTVGYQWFLQALHLDGSEKVGAATEKNQVNKGPSSPHDEIILSDLLDLKIRWPTELETDNTITNKKPEQSKSSYNSTGIDLDNFLSFPKWEDTSSAQKDQAATSSNSEAAVNRTVGTHEDLSLFENLRSSEPAVTSSTVQTAENKTVGTHEDLSLFENLRSSEPAVTSATVQTAENKTVGTPGHSSLFENLRSSEPAVTSATVQTADDFSGWEADFQSAGSGEQNLSNISSTPVGSAVDSGGHDAFTTFGTSTSSTVSSGNQHEDSKSTDAFVSSDIDLSAQLDTVFGTAKGPTDGKRKDVIAVSSAAHDWPAVELWDSSNPEASHKTGEILPPIVRDKDADLQNSSNDPSTSIDWFQDDTWQTHNAPAPKHDTTNGDHDSFDEWNTFASSTSIKDPFENAPAPKDDTANGDHDSFDKWNTFTSSAAVKDPFENAPAPTLDTATGDHDSFDEWNTFTSSTAIKDPFKNVPAPTLDTANGDHDSFDEWNTFTSSTPIKDPFENVLVQSDNDNNNKSNAELTNFSSNLEDMDFGSFSQSDPFSGAGGKDCVPTEVNDNILEVPTIFSSVDTPSKVGDNGHTSENTDMLGKSNLSKDDMDIESIMSQMHDLSFMLKTNLSVPSKPNSSLPKD